MSERGPLTAEEFAALSPEDRGWAVYMAGNREDQPNIPNERNPYPKDSAEWHAWNRGAERAAIEVQDSEE